MSFGAWIPWPGPSPVLITTGDASPDFWSTRVTVLPSLSTMYSAPSGPRTMPDATNPSGSRYSVFAAACWTL